MQMMKRLVVSGREDQADKIFPHFSVHQQKIQALATPKPKSEPKAGPQAEGGGLQPPVPKTGGTEPQERVMENMAEQVMGGGGA
jgi:hypothetical protein